MIETVNRLRRALVSRVLDGPGVATAEARRHAFDNRGVGLPERALVEKVARTAWKVTDADVAAVTAAGRSDDEIFELVVCAALGQSTRQLESALAALKEIP